MGADGFAVRAADQILDRCLTVVGILEVATSFRATTWWCTSSGPSARRSVRCLWYMLASGVQWLMPGGAVDLDRLVNDLADPFGHHGLDHGNPDAGFLVAQHVHGPGGFQHHQAHGLDVDLGAADQFHVLAEVNDPLAKRFAGHARD